MAFREDLVARLISNSQNFVRNLWKFQLFAALLFLGLGYLMGHEHFHLIREGVRAPGTIIGHKLQDFRSSSGNSSSTSTAYMPIVEFRAGDRSIQFKDWLGSRVPGSTNVPVTVLYDPANPSDAMIDRPTWNWLPWAPVGALGVFLVLVGINGFFRSQRLAETS